MNGIQFRVFCIVAAAVCLLSPRVAEAAGAADSLYAITANRISELDPNTGALLNSFLPPVPPQTGGGSGLAFSGSALYYASIDAATIYTLNPATGAVVNSFAAPAGLGIDALGYGPSSFGPTLFALQYTPNRLHLLNPTNGTAYTSLLLGFDAIGGVDFNHVTSQLLVGDQAGVVRRLNPNTGAVLGSFPAGQFQYGIGVVGSRVFTANISTIFERNPSSGAVLNQFVNPAVTPIGALAGGPIPEPGSLLLFIAGFALLLALRRARPILSN
jgi:outer membrane protein assembly factor BamB